MVNDHEPAPVNLHADLGIALIEFRGVFDEIGDRPFDSGEGRKHRGFVADVLPDFHDHRSLPSSANTRGHSASRLGESKLLRCLSASSPDATATSSLTSSVSSPTSLSRSSRICSCMSGAMSGCRRSTARFVRRLVNGVRSSWPAFCTNRCCSPCDRWSAPSIEPNAEPRRPTSSFPARAVQRSGRPTAPLRSPLG